MGLFMLLFSFEQEPDGRWNWASGLGLGGETPSVVVCFCVLRKVSLHIGGSEVNSERPGEGAGPFSSALIFVDIAEVALMVFVLRVVSSCDFLVDLGKNLFRVSPSQR